MASPSRTPRPRPSGSRAGKPAARSAQARPSASRAGKPEARSAQARPSASRAGKPAPKGPSTAKPASNRPAPAHPIARRTSPATSAPKRPTAARPASARPGKPASARPGKPVAAGERLQKLLAAAGVASRRACEAIILEGRVQVNGVTVTELGTRADPRRDEITVDLQPIAREQLVYILVNKPKGYVTTVKDDQGRPTVMALLHGVDARVYPVGRLDFNSEGLLLLTNDGALAQRLAAPEHHVPKVYLVKVYRTPKPETLAEFREGFRLDGRRLKPCGVEVMEKADNPWLKVTLIEGKNQQIRRMFAAVGHPVSKLRRIQFGPLDDPSLKPGQWRFLSPQELVALKNL